MRYSADHKDKTRETLLKEAALAIRRDGPAGLSLSAVMKSAGLTNGGFYAHFKSRDDLLEAGIEQLFREATARLLLEREGDAGDNLRDFVRFYLSPKHRDARTFGCPLALLNSDAPRLPSRAAKRYAAGMSSLAGVIASALKAIGSEHPEDEASSLLSELIGALGRARAEPDPEQSDLVLKRSRRAILRRLTPDAT
ncbi:MAG: TetR/AcrR family transcriptional regulator [Hyphomonadaceae bacterium]